MERTLSQILFFENPYGVNHIIVSSKSSHQDLSIEGVKHFLDLLVIAFSAAQKWAFFDKLPKITDRLNCVEY